MEFVDDALRTHPELRPWLDGYRSATRLAGLTNINIAVEAPAGRFVLRLPGKGTEEYINRGNEKTAAEVASGLGVNAPLHYFDGKSGLQLSGFLEGAVTMSAERFRDRGAIARAAASLRRVHRSGESFASRFELFAMIDDYLELLDSKHVELPEGFREGLAEAESVRRALAARPVPSVPCHCDPLAENFLDTGERMFVVDWEYAGNNDPMWDLADVSVEAGFDDAQDDAILQAYFEGGSVAPFDRGRMILYKAMCDLLWTLWGTIQHANGNPADDFHAYALNRFARCRALMARPVFGEALGWVGERYGLTL